MGNRVSIKAPYFCIGFLVLNQKPFLYLFMGHFDFIDLQVKEPSGSQ